MPCEAYFDLVTTKITSAFRSYGEFVGKHPIPFIILPIMVFGGMGAGLAVIEHETDLEKVYFPRNSRALKDRQFVRDTFPKQDSVPYNSFSQSDKDNAVNIIFKTKEGRSIFDTSITSEISEIIEGVKKIDSSGKKYGDICAKTRDGKCYVGGEFAISTGFQRAIAGRVVTYPVWNHLYLFRAISGVNETGGKLFSASVLMISFKLREEAKDWKKIFLKYAASLEPIKLDVIYETPDSLGEELDKSTKGDIVFFSLTISVCCTYASLVTTGGNPVSTRSMLAFAGILAAGLGILGSMGLLSVCGVKFVNIVGVVPFLIIGIGVDDMFLLMSSWSESLPSDVEEQNMAHVPVILGRTLAKAGIGITITSVTDFLAFGIGTVSVFLSVTNFSLYAGVAVLFCYLANITLFSASLAFHGRRVYSARHSMTCRVTKPREQLKQEGKSACYALMCGGSIPSKAREDESPCEKFPSKILPLLFRNKIVSIVIIILFLGYIGISTYGMINLKQGLVLQNLVQDNSYYHKFLTVRDKYFATRIPVGFYAKEKIDYLGKEGHSFEDILEEARTDDAVDSEIQSCWLTDFRKMPLFNSSTSDNLVKNLERFTSNNQYKNDIVFDSAKTEVISSRCFIMSKPSVDQYANAELMAKMRKLATDSSLPVFAYHWSFTAFEQFVAVLPATLLLVGCAIAVMTVVTFIFLPHILMVMLVVLTIVMILLGIFGFLYFWDLTLSSITMIHLVMSVGFSVDFSAHVCAAYLLSHPVTRQERARDAIRHAAGPILNGATSTMLGVLFLLASKSYIFQSFFKVMFLVIFFGLLHAVFFLPAILSLIGPENRAGQTNDPPAKENPAAAKETPAAAKETPAATADPIVNKSQSATTEDPSQSASASSVGSKLGESSSFAASDVQGNSAV